MIKQAICLRKKNDGEYSRSTLASIHSLGVILLGSKKYIEAEKQIVNALTGRRKLLGDKHPLIVQSLKNLSTALSGQEKNEEANKKSKQAFHLSALIKNERDAYQNGADEKCLFAIWYSQINLARYTDELDEKLTQYYSSLKTAENILSHYRESTERMDYVAFSQFSIGNILSKQQRINEALGFYQGALNTRKRIIILFGESIERLHEIWRLQTIIALNLTQLNKVDDATLYFKSLSLIHI